jgi:hypothetical protein
MDKICLRDSQITDDVKMVNRVPIPRLKNDSHKSHGKRTTRACNSCRQRKWKCDGKKPVCTQCEAQSLKSCIYSENKLLRERKELQLAREKIALYEDLLQELSREVDASVSMRIKDVLKVRLNFFALKGIRYCHLANVQRPRRSIPTEEDLPAPLHRLPLAH